MLTRLKEWLHIEDKNERSNRWIFGVILVSASLSLLSAFVLSVENYELIKNPDALLSCNINAFLNCASVMKTDESHVFGFPNSFLGLMTEPILITMAVGYFAGARYKKWFYVLATVGSGLGSLFAYWLFFQSVYDIQVLCPWCLIVTVCTTLIFEALLRFNLRENNFNLNKKLHTRVLVWLEKDYDKFITAAWLATLTTIVFIQFPGILG